MSGVTGAGGISGNGDTTGVTGRRENSGVSGRVGGVTGSGEGEPGVGGPGGGVSFRAGRFSKISRRLCCAAALLLCVDGQ